MLGYLDVNENLDNEYIFSDIEMARRLLNYNLNQISPIEFKLNEDADEDVIRDAIQSYFR